MKPGIAKVLKKVKLLCVKKVEVKADQNIRNNLRPEYNDCKQTCSGLPN
jgi:hypothetical protein